MALQTIVNERGSYAAITSLTPSYSFAQEFEAWELFNIPMRISAVQDTIFSAYAIWPDLRAYFEGTLDWSEFCALHELTGPQMTTHMLNVRAIGEDILGTFIDPRNRSAPKIMFDFKQWLLERNDLPKILREELDDVVEEAQDEINTHVEYACKINSVVTPDHGQALVTTPDTFWDAHSPMKRLLPLIEEWMNQNGKTTGHEITKAFTNFRTPEGKKKPFDQAILEHRRTVTGKNNHVLRAWKVEFSRMTPEQFHFFHNNPFDQRAAVVWWDCADNITRLVTKTVNSELDVHTSEDWATDLECRGVDPRSDTDCDWDEKPCSFVDGYFIYFKEVPTNQLVCALEKSTEKFIIDLTIGHLESEYVSEGVYDNTTVLKKLKAAKPSYYTKCSRPSCKEAIPNNQLFEHIRTCWRGDFRPTQYAVSHEMTALAKIGMRCPCGYRVPQSMSRWADHLARCNEHDLYGRAIPVIKIRKRRRVPLPCGGKIAGYLLRSHYAECLDCLLTLCTCPSMKMDEKHLANCLLRKEWVPMCGMCGMVRRPGHEMRCYRVEQKFNMHCDIRTVDGEVSCSICRPLLAEHSLDFCMKKYYDNVEHEIQLWVPEKPITAALSAMVRNNTSRATAQMLEGLTAACAGMFSDLKQAVVEARDTTAQMRETLIEVEKSVKDGGRSIDSLTGEISSTLKKTDTLIHNSNQAVKQVSQATRRVPEQVSDFLDLTSMTSRILSVVSNLYLYFTGELNLTRTTACLLNLLTQIPGIGNALSKMDLRIFGWAKDFYAWTSQKVNTLTRAESLEMPSWMAGVIGLIISALFAILHGHFPGDSFIAKAVKTITAMGGISRGLEFTVKGVSALVRFCYEYLYEFVMGVSPYAGELAAINEDFTSFMDSVDALRRELQYGKIPAVRREPFRAEVLAADATCTALAKRLAETNHPNHVVSLFRQYQTSVRDLVTKTGGIQVENAETHEEPLIVFMYGDSGVGKSTITPLLAEDLVAKTMRLNGNARDFIYNRGVEHEYWVGYHGQPVCVYDDFGQMRDSAARPNLEYMELIRTGNTAPMFCHMAGIEDKDSTPFTSKVLIATSNTPFLRPASVTYPEAVRRRLDIAVKVTRNPDVAPGPMNVNFSRFQIYDPCKQLEDQELGPKLEYREFAQLVSKAYIAKRTQQRAKRNVLDEMATDLSYMCVDDPLAKKNEKALPLVVEHMADVKVVEPTKKKIPVGRRPTNVFDEMMKKIMPKSMMEASRIEIDDDDMSQEFVSLADDDIDEHPEEAKEDAHVPREVAEDTDAGAALFDELAQAHSEFELTASMIHAESDYYCEFLPRANTAHLLGVIAEMDPADQVMLENSFNVAIDLNIISMPKRCVKLFTRSGSHLEIVELVNWLESPLLVNAEKGAVIHYVKHNANDTSNLRECLRPVSAFIFDHYACQIYDRNAKRLRAQFKQYVAKARRAMYHLVPTRPILWYLGIIVGSATFSYTVTSGLIMVLEYLLGARQKFTKGEDGIPMYNYITGMDHTGMEIGKVYRHTHFCSDCKSQYEHTHKIRDALEMSKYGPLLCGDCARKTKAEVASSGDPRTMKRTGAVIYSRAELASSGDVRTVRPGSTRVVTHAELLDPHMMIPIDQPDTKDNRIQPYMAPAPTVAQMGQAEMLTDVNCFEIRHKVLNNCYRMEAYSEDGKKTGQTYGLFTEGQLFLTIGHMKFAMDKKGWVTIDNHSMKKPQQISCDQIVVTTIATSDGNEPRDLMLMDLGRDVTPHANVSKYFMDAKGHSKIANFSGVLIRNSANAFNTMSYGQVEAKDGLNYAYGPLVLKDRRHFEYHMETKQGDCGAPLFIVDKTAPRKLIGLHAAGNPAGAGMSVPIFLEEYESMKRVLLARRPAAQMAYIPEYDGPIAADTPEGNFVPLTKVSERPGTSSKSTLQPSKIHGLVTEATTMPAKLGPFVFDGEELNPMEIGLKKAGLVNHLVNRDQVEEATTGFEYLLQRSKQKAPELARVLSDAEMVAGVSDEAFAPPINRATSAGYPWNLKCKDGKKELISEEYNMVPELARAISEREIKAKRGERSATIWVDTLKDERRPIAKVQAGKTRVFSNGPVDYTLLFRKYFLGFAAALERDRINNEIAVGVNPFGYDWHRLTTHLQQKGPAIVAGDFSNYDGTLQITILNSILDMINRWYNDGEENALVRETLWCDIVYAVHLRGKDLYMWTHGQPSGCPLTAILNSCYNSIAVRYVYLSLAAKHAPGLRDTVSFERNVAMIAYGDDNAINIANTIVDWFNQVTLAEGFKELGMIYTDEAKSGVLVPYRTISEINFLKRSFRYEEVVGRYVAPLAMETIQEMVNWVRKGGLDWHTATRVNVETARFELALHGKGVYDQLAPAYESACLAKHLYVPFPKWEPFVRSQLEQIANGMIVGY